MRHFIILIGVCIGFASFPVRAEDTVATAADAHEASSFEFRLPLDHGRLNLRDVLHRLCETLGVKTGESIAKLDWTVDVQSALGRLQLSLFDRLASGVVSTQVQDEKVVVKVNRQRLAIKLREAGKTIDAWVSDLIGRTENAGSRSYGITLITGQSPRTQVKDLSNPPHRAVILVHGLDDPGFMWNDLLPKLQETGYAVGRFEYPNDGPIGDAADLLASELSAARQKGIERVDIVAHSMGGLVARDVLTRPAYYNGDGAASDRYPAVDRLIMLGTPNHGSEMSRLRGISEIGEHIARALTGQPYMATETGDGSGEAGVDLLPRSDFLRRLNARPLPTHTQLTNIAGQWAPLGAGEVDALLAKTRRVAESSKAPKWLRDWATQENEKLVSSVLVSAINGLGDGCVTIESARLEGVEDFVIIQANHVDMLKSLGVSDAAPPAIPIVLDRLARP
jgi:pimeloyl-ACP methyl ester carboxylesterase